MASQKQQRSSTCGKCSKRVVKVGICCEGDVTQSGRAMKREVQQHLDHKRTRDQMVNVELLMK